MNIFLRLLLAPFSFIFEIGTEIRNKFYDWQLLRVHEFDIPIINVGNLTVGGTGKTPHTEYLIKLLSEKYKLAVLSRGYKRDSNGFIKANEKSSVQELGDELFQIHKKYKNIGVFACADRVSGVKKIMKDEAGYQVILLDDAFQHRSIKAGLNILLSDFNRPFYTDKLMPVGRLREHPHNKKRAKIIITTKCPLALKPIEQRIIITDLKAYPYQNLYFSGINYQNVYPIFRKNKKKESFSSFLQFFDHILLLTGIANNKPIINELKKQGKTVEIIKFPDHHNFNEGDLERVNKTFENMQANKTIITTEKDAMRLLKFSKKEIKFKNDYHFVDISISFLKQEEQQTFNQEIIKYVENNRRKQ